jgi:hydrogenase maturation protease
VTDEAIGERSPLGARSPGDPGWRLGDAMPAAPPAPRANPEPPPARYAILGLGNRLQGDEALGGLVIEQLEAAPELLGALPDQASVDLVDGGTVGLALIPRLCGLDGLVVVDLVNADAEPGTFIDLDGAAVLRHETVMGVHELGAEELLGALLFMDALPRRVRVVGLQPDSISLGTELTPRLAAAVPDLIRVVVDHVAAWQAEDATAT